LENRLRYYLGYIGGDEKIMLKWVLKQISCKNVDLIYLAQAAQALVVGPYECSNEVVVSIKTGSFLSSILKFGLVKKHCTIQLIT
jgi:hypothetical protein